MQLIWGDMKCTVNFGGKITLKSFPSKTRNRKGSKSYPAAAIVISNVEFLAITSRSSFYSF
jgi:hypothetical protein